MFQMLSSLSKEHFAKAIILKLSWEESIRVLIKSALEMVILILTILFILKKMLISLSLLLSSLEKVMGLIETSFIITIKIHQLDGQLLILKDLLLTNIGKESKLVISLIKAENTHFITRLPWSTLVKISVIKMKWRLFLKLVISNSRRLQDKSSL